MTTFAFTPPPQPSVAVAGSGERFPVRRVYCVGRNYAAHAREMGADPTREPPFFFMKPADAVVDDGATLEYPPETGNLHHEVELVVAIGRAGFAVPADEALGLVWGYGAGLDLTRRDLQTQAKDAGKPWEWGKAFDHSAPCAPLVAVAAAGHVNKGRIWLSVNGAVRQDADVGQLTWSPAEVIAAISRSMRLEPGDLIYTGTPAGVGPLVRGDRVEGAVEGLPPIRLSIAG